MAKGSVASYFQAAYDEFDAKRTGVKVDGQFTIRGVSEKEAHAIYGVMAAACHLDGLIEGMKLGIDKIPDIGIKLTAEVLKSRARNKDSPGEGPDQYRYDDETRACHFSFRGITSREDLARIQQKLKMIHTAVFVNAEPAYDKDIGQIMNFTVPLVKIAGAPPAALADLIRNGLNAICDAEGIVPIPADGSCVYSSPNHWHPSLKGKEAVVYMAKEVQEAMAVKEKNFGVQRPGHG